MKIRPWATPHPRPCLSNRSPLQTLKFRSRSPSYRGTRSYKLANQTKTQTTMNKRQAVKYPLVQKTRKHVSDASICLFSRMILLTLVSDTVWDSTELAEDEEEVIEMLAGGSQNFKQEILRREEEVAHVSTHSIIICSTIC